MLRNHVARVYRYKGANEHIAACAYATGGEFVVDAPTDEFQAFGPPSRGLRGAILGFAVEDCGDICFTYVEVDDVRGKQGSREPLHRSTRAAVHGSHFVKVGSLRVRYDGGVAWITCPERGGPPVGAAFDATHEPNCTGPGDKDWVIKLDASSRRRRVLDHGRSVDPSSLRPSRGRLTWRHDGHRRHARLR